MKLIEEIKKQFGDNLLYIGLRGSRCLDLQTPKSDYDLTIVVKEDLDYSSMNHLENNHIMSRDTFIKTVKEFSYNGIEAIFNHFYISTDFIEDYISLYDYIEVNQEIGNKLLKLHILKMYKNFYKRLTKLIDIDKTKAKVLLFNKLMSEDLLYIFKYHTLEEKLRQKYFKHLSGKFTREEDKEIVQTLEDRLQCSSSLKEQINTLNQFLKEEK